jgi:hypothetical protein
LFLGDLAATSAQRPVAPRLMPLQMAHAGCTTCACSLGFVALTWRGLQRQQSQHHWPAASKQQGLFRRLPLKSSPLACLLFVSKSSNTKVSRAFAAVTVHADATEEKLQFISFLENSNDDLSKYSRAEVAELVESSGLTLSVGAAIILWRKARQKQLQQQHSHAVQS